MTGHSYHFGVFIIEVNEQKIPGKEVSYVINPLKADETYKVWMASVSSSGEMSASAQLEAEISKDGRFNHLPHSRSNRLCTRPLRVPANHANSP